MTNVIEVYNSALKYVDDFFALTDEQIQDLPSQSYPYAYTCFGKILPKYFYLFDNCTIDEDDIDKNINIIQKDAIIDEIALDESVVSFFKNCDTFYIHKKRKTWYKILHNATMQCNTSGGIELDDEEMIVYMDVEGKVWVRTSYEFFDGRFTKFVLTKIDDNVIGN